MRVVLLLVLLAACGSQGYSEPPLVVGATVPVVTDAAVVAFWLGAVDTLPEKSRRAIQAEFRRSNDAIADYLSDTDVALVTTLSDTVVVESGDQRYLVLLSGFDFPFGYLLVEPGYDEEFHTGLMIDEDLEAVIDEYFELAEVDSLDRRRIAAGSVIRPAAKGRDLARLAAAAPAGFPKSARTALASVGERRHRLVARSRTPGNL
jgi:hypothetical protein